MSWWLPKPGITTPYWLATLEGTQQREKSQTRACRDEQPWAHPCFCVPYIHRLHWRRQRLAMQRAQHGHPPPVPRGRVGPRHCSLRYNHHQLARPPADGYVAARFDFHPPSFRSPSCFTLPWLGGSSMDQRDEEEENTRHSLLCEFPGSKTSWKGRQP